MIAALGEGITQSLLPCSWVLLFPAVALGFGTRRVAVLASFSGAVVLAAWIAAAGWFVAPLWLAGAALLVGGLLWWRLGATYVPAAIIGGGAAWAWRPCVGPELGEALTTAQYDPVAAFGGLAMFLLGVIAVGLAIGLAGGAVLDRLGRGPSTKAGAGVVAALGLTMVLGVYPTIASALARWSTALWA
jgi:cytochrome c biogenesis protein CcdA